MTKQRQIVMHCPCGKPKVLARGMCANCYTLKRQDEAYFGGHREEVLKRDSYRCRVPGCTTVKRGKRSVAVHHRKPGNSDPSRMLCLCLSCHAKVSRTLYVRNDWPEFLRILWREQHPEGHEQGALNFTIAMPIAENMPLFSELVRVFCTRQQQDKKLGFKGVTNVEDVSKVEGERSNWYEEAKDRPSTFVNIRVSVSGQFKSEEQAQQLWETVYAWLYLIGKVLDLSGLSKVIVTGDYNEALAELDRGFKTENVLVPTGDDVAVGVAMTPMILEDGILKSVMVLNTAHVIALLFPDNQEFKPHFTRMVYTLAHEGGHAHDHAIQAKCFPDVFLKTKLSQRDSRLFTIAEACWSEYIASRLSAFLSGDITTEDYESTFCQRVAALVPSSRVAITQYRMHHDVTRVLDEVSLLAKHAVVYGSYLMGQLDGLGITVEEGAPKAYEAVMGTPLFQPYFTRLRWHLQTLHASYGTWTTLDVHSPMKQLVSELLVALGLELTESAEGLYCNIPFTSETMPSLSEELAFRTSLSVTGKKIESEIR